MRGLSTMDKVENTTIVTTQSEARRVLALLMDKKERFIHAADTEVSAPAQVQEVGTDDAYVTGGRYRY